MQAVRVIGALLPADACTPGGDWAAPGNCIWVVNCHFPALISSAARDGTELALARITVSRIPPAALVIILASLVLLLANKHRAIAFQGAQMGSGKSCHGTVA